MTNVVASNINKTSATLTITTTDPMTLYYGRVLRGTRYLQFADVKSRKAPQYTSTNTVYFTSYTYSTTTTI